MIFSEKLYYREKCLIGSSRSHFAKSKYVFEEVGVVIQAGFTTLKFLSG